MMETITKRKLKIEDKLIKEMSAHTDGGPRSRSVHARPSAWPPIDMSENLQLHVSAESPSNISPKYIIIIITHIAQC